MAPEEVITSGSKASRQWNARQTKILTSSHRLLQFFIKREWFSLFISSGLGVLAAESVHLLWRDRSFGSFLVTKYEPSVSFDDPRYYAPYLAVALALVLLAVSGFVVGFAWRGIRSFAGGVTSGLVALPFASAFLLSMLPSAVRHRLLYGGLVALTWLCASFCLYLAAKMRAERTVLEGEFKVPLNIRSIAGSQVEESDDPIESWPQDALGRAALVDSLSVRIMIAKVPVLMLSGAFGAGKTSILNLLREHLGDKAIVVLFSTWLPGSVETLTSYLLADIANECKKQYVVPGLRHSARRFATALGQKVPLLADYLKVLPVATQKDDINNLKSALVRLPKRVVVLLDEIDRMDKEELIALLKMIRGISTLPNLTFVCAGDRETIIRTVKGDYRDESIAYFEKFFPVIIPVPEPAPESLRKAGIERLVSAFVSREWFENDPQVERFRKQLGDAWDTRIGPYCRNLRAVGLLANSVSVASALLRREVDPLDLTLIEVLNQFRPSVYELVANNSLVLTGGESMARGGPYQTDEDAAQNRDRFVAKLKHIIQNQDELELVEGILRELFPLFSPDQPRLRRPQVKRTDSDDESDKRIRQAGVFPAYFRYQLPDAIFSYVEMASLGQRLERAASQSAREAAFSKTLRSMEKGSLKRDDFLRKLTDLAKSLPTPVAMSLGVAAAESAAEYTYDIMSGFGEAGHVLRLILAIAQRLPKTERITFLRKCILNAGDDTMAFRVLTILPQQKDDSNIDVTVADLYETFIMRMRKRYGRSVDATNIDLSASDPWAFNYWGSEFDTKGIKSDPDDRKMQHEFWLRYIGNSRLRLAQAFRQFFLPFAHYDQDPIPLVENKISIEDLRRLSRDLPDDPTLREPDVKSLDRLRRFLAGEFKHGISPISDIW